MLTYQDLEKVKETGNIDKLMNFVLSVKEEHENSDLYETAVLANEYDKQQNRTIKNLNKTIVTAVGAIVQDRWSPNHKMISNFYNTFTEQRNQYLLSNGISFSDEKTKERLGKDIDDKLRKLGKKAMDGGVCFGFWNYDHLEVFPIYQSGDSNAIFAPIYDEMTGALRAGVRYWQIDTLKPLFATLYDEDGYITFKWESGKRGEIAEPKQGYKSTIKRSKNEGITSRVDENYSTLPIFPLWANDQHQSEIVGLQSKIDCYDIIVNSFANDVDTAQLYWIIHGAVGADQEDLLKFIDEIHTTHVAGMNEETTADPVTIEPPSQSREILLTRIKNDMYEDFGALNVGDIKAGNVTATQILAAYERLDMKANGYEYQVLAFVNQLLGFLGIEDNATFTRSKIINMNETIQALSMSASWLSEDYITRKLLELFGDGDKADDMIQERTAEDIQRLEAVEDKDQEDEEKSEESKE